MITPRMNPCEYCNIKNEPQKLRSPQVFVEDAFGRWLGFYVCPTCGEWIDPTERELAK